MPTHVSVVDLALGTSATPGAQAITVPADATGVAVFFGEYSNFGGTHTLTSLAASFVSGGFTINQSADASSAHGLVGVAYGLVTATGSQTITPTWDATVVDGPIFQVVFFKDIDTGDYYRDSDHNNDDDSSSGVTSSTPAIDSAATDLVYGFVTEYSTIPTVSGWTQRQSTALTNSMYGSVYTADSPGSSSTTFTCGTADFPAVAALSIKATGGGGGSYNAVPLLQYYQSLKRGGIFH